LNHPGSGTIDLWFATFVGADAGAVLGISAGVPAHVPDIFCFCYSTDGTLLNSLSSFSLPVLLAFDSMSCMSCSSDSS